MTRSTAARRVVAPEALAQIVASRDAAVAHENAAALSRAQAAAARSAMEILIVQALAELGVQADTQVVCLACGTLRPSQQPLPPCGGCAPAR